MPFPPEMISIAVLVSGIIIWAVRAESRVGNVMEKSQANREEIERVNQRIAKLEDRQDGHYAEMRTLMMSIQKSISNLEGRLSISVKGE